MQAECASRAYHHTVKALQKALECGDYAAAHKLINILSELSDLIEA